MRAKVALSSSILGLFGLAWFGFWPDKRMEVTGSITIDGDAILKRPRERPGTASSSQLRKAGHQVRFLKLDVHACCPPDGRWLNENPAKATMMAHAMEPGKLRDRLLLQAIRAWADKSPEETRRWLEERSRPDERDRLLQAIENEPGTSPASTIDKLAQAARDFEWDDSKRPLVENLTGQWAGEDLGAARDWVMSQPEGGIRDALVQRIALVQGGNDPAEAARLVAEEIPPGPAQTEAVLTVVNRWALQNPTAAAAWVADFPDGPIRQRAQQELDGLAAYRANIR
jgi:hypothetical protein